MTWIENAVEVCYTEAILNIYMCCWDMGDPVVYEWISLFVFKGITGKIYWIIDFRTKQDILQLSKNFLCLLLALLFLSDSGEKYWIVTSHSYILHWQKYDEISANPFSKTQTCWQTIKNNSESYVLHLRISLVLFFSGLANEFLSILKTSFFI